MPALPSSVIDPLWSQFKTLLPTIDDGHPLGCHRRRVADRIIFDKLVTRLVLGGAYTKHADSLVSATTLRCRRDEWIAHGVFVRLEQIVGEAFDQIIGLDLTHLSIDGCCAKAPCGGDNTGPNPTDRGKSGQKRSVLVEGHGLPIGVILAGANRHDSPLLRPTLECLSRFGFFLPETMRATEPIPMAVLEAKAREYLQARLQRQNQLNRAGLTITKNGHVLPDTDTDTQRADQSVVTVTRANRQVYYHGYHVSLPSTLADRQFYRTITDEAFLLTDMDTGEIVFSFPLPMVALGVRGRFISSYAIRGVQVTNPTKQWRSKYEQYADEFASRGEDMPDVFTLR